jgi:hypothetical protein
VATASARPKKQSIDPALTPTTMCDGTPIIMQGMDCSRRPARGAQQEQATERAERPRVTRRGSGGPYIAPLQRPLSLTLTQPSAGPYIPPPVNNPASGSTNSISLSHLTGAWGITPPTATPTYATTSTGSGSRRSYTCRSDQIRTRVGLGANTSYDSEQFRSAPRTG